MTPLDTVSEPRPLASPVAFPLFAIVDGKCGCGNEKCSRVGKHPACKWGELKYGDAVPMPDPGAGYGLKTGAAPKGSDFIVVDVDDFDSFPALDAKNDEHDGGCFDTYVVATPRGLHLYFQDPGFYVSNSAGDLAKGVDVRGDGGFVVGPGSPHRSGGTYELLRDVDPAPAPKWLLSWLRERSKPPAEVQPHADDVTDPDERARRRSLFADYAQRAPAAVEGQRDVRIWPIVQHGALDLRLPTEDIYEVIADEWNPRCSPPFEDEELRRVVLHKANDAKTRSLRRAAEPWPVEVAHLAHPPSPASKSVMITETETPAPATPARESLPIWDWNTPIEQPVWLVDGLIPAGTVGALVAHGSSLKTWTMLSKGIAISKGERWLGKYSTKCGRVLVVDYESGAWELRRRVHLLGGSDSTNLGAFIYPRERIDDPDFWKRIADVEDVVLVCIDSLAEGASGVDENDTRAARPLSLAARYSETTGAAVEFLHHSKKDDAGDARKAVRGSSAIYAAMDWGFSFDLVEETTTSKRMLMKSIKPCMGPKPMPIAIELTDAGLHLYDEGAARVGQDSAGRHVPADERIKLAIEMGGPMAGYIEVASATGLAEKVARRELRLMVERGDLVRGAGRKLYLGAADSQRARACAAVAKAQASGRALHTVKDLMRLASVTKEAVDALLAERALVWDIPDASVKDENGETARRLVLVDRQSP